MRNLLSNAVKHSKVRYADNGEKVADILVDCKTRSEFLTIKIVNPGQLPKNEQDSLFEPYYKDLNNPAEGLHLGLAIAKQWVDDVGGELRVENLDDDISYLTL
jgi:K+-sensing histidine kinase KdpD